ncbi:acyl-CoA dehydrogenase family protein [Oceanobacillus saliphilus]|uniref:acyl-CoA dehydrogenase family protein n=1 Tax=Oceanobacillus saliphilus TaxID=2925834 RepID=UPI00201E48E2|nr:acyl-CoA dehydrogenase family protein [Oceanobacillus saliphilus]
MNFQLTEEQLAWQQEVRSFIKENVTPELLAEVKENDDKQPGPLEKAYLQKVIKKGWQGLNWPKEYGGLNKSAIDRLIFIEEMRYNHAPDQELKFMEYAANAIIKKGTEENKKTWLPKFMNGEIIPSMSYSEPDSGTDLASLRTRAELDGDEWVINGHKIWNTRGHRATHQWLAARTDLNAPKHKGISIFVVPMNTPGITVVEIKTWDHRVNEVFFENVLIPKDFLIGEMNQGWNIITSALNTERFTIGIGSHIWRLYDELVEYCNRTERDGELLINRSEVKQRLSELKMEIEIARLFSFKAAWMQDVGQDISSFSSMSKIYTTELSARVVDYATQIFELYGQLNDDETDPLYKTIAGFYRAVPLRRFGGGTNEVMRNIVAQRGLSLPRK